MVGWDFFDSRRQRYGPILRTHLFGRPVVRVSSGEFVRQILIKEHNIIDSAYPTSVRVSSSVDAVSCCFQPAELVSVGNLVMRKTYSMRHVSDMVLFSFDECNTQSYYTYHIHCGTTEEGNCSYLPPWHSYATDSEICPQVNLETYRGFQRFLYLVTREEPELDSGPLSSSSSSLVTKYNKSFQWGSKYARGLVVLN